MSRTLSVAALALSLLLVPSTSWAEEVQGWRTMDDHIHTSIPLAQFATINKPVTVDVTTLLHNRAGGRLTFVRWADEGTVAQTVKLDVVGTGENEQRVSTPITLDPAKFKNSGWRELRITSNFVDSNGDREFTTTRLCVNVVNGKARKDYCGGPTVTGRCGGGAWYDATDYSVVTVDCRDVALAQSRPLRAGDRLRFKAQAGQLFVNLDPHFHDHDHGLELVTAAAKGKWITVTIPVGLTPGTHRLHALDQRSNGEAGVYVLTFTTI